FAKFQNEIDENFKKNKYSQLSNYNAIAKIALEACESHIKTQDLKYPIVKLDCLIFYSTYISLISSYLQLSNTDNIDIYLMEGINLYFDSLGLDKDDFYLGFNDYVKSRSYLFSKSIQVIKEVNFETNSKTPYYIGLFEANDFIEIDDVELTDTILLAICFEYIKINLKLIDEKYEMINDKANFYKLEKWKRPAVTLIEVADIFIEKLVIYPFEESRCQICGNLDLRENLK